MSKHNSINRFFVWIRRSGLMRANSRWVGGVCSGLAIRYGISAALLRAIVIAASLVGGLGMMFYAVAWALLPDASDGRIAAEDLIHGHWSAAIVGALVLWVLAVWVPGVGFFGFLISVAVLLLLINNLDRKVRAMPQNGPQGGQQPSPGPWSQPGPQAGPQPQYGPQGASVVPQQSTPWNMPHSGSFQGQQGFHTPQGDQDSLPQGDAPQSAAVGRPGDADQSGQPGQSTHSHQADRPDQSGQPCGSDQPGQASQPDQVNEPINPAESGPAFGPGPAPASAPRPLYTQALPWQYAQAAPRLREQQRPRRQRRKPAGTVLTLSTLGFILLAAAIALALIVSRGMYLEGTLHVVSVTVAVVCLAIGLLIFVLGVMGRRAGGLKLLAVLVAMVTVVSIGMDSAYAVSLQDAHRISHGYVSVNLGDNRKVMDSSKAAMAELERGMAFTGNDFNRAGATIDLSDYAGTHGKHQVKLENGKTIDSSCPTGRINLTAIRSHITIDMPMGCSYVLTNVRAGLVGVYQRHDGTTAKLYVHGDGTREIQFTKHPHGSGLHVQLSGRNGGHLSVTTGGDDDDDDDDEDDDDDDEDEDDDWNWGDDGYTDDDEHAGSRQDGYWFGWMPMRLLAPGIQELGSPYTVSVNGDSRMGFGRDTSTPSKAASGSKGYDWMNSSDTMPADGPELIISAPALVQSQVNVSYEDAPKSPVTRK